MVTADPTRRSPHTTARLAAEAEAVPSRRRGRGSPQYRSSAGATATILRNAADVMFAQMMIRITGGPSIWAKLAASGASTAEVKKLAADIEAAQEEQTNGRNPDAVALAKQIESAQTADVALIDRLLTTT